MTRRTCCPRFINLRRWTRELSTSESFLLLVVANDRFISVPVVVSSFSIELGNPEIHEGLLAQGRT